MLSSPEFGCSVTYNPAIPCVVMEWRGYATSVLFREANERVLAAIAERRASRLLGDVTDFVLIGAEDQAWLNENWLPRAIAAGLRRCAIVQPQYYFNRVAVEAVAKKINPERLEVGFFADQETAIEWLAG